MEKESPERNKKNNPYNSEAAEQILFPPPSVRNLIIHEALDRVVKRFLPQIMQKN